MARSVKKRVVWALDPFTDLKDSLKSTAALVQSICQRENWALEPVYVLSPDGFNWTGDFSGAWVSRYKPYIEKSMNELLQTLGVESHLPPKVIVNKQLSLRDDVKKLLSYTKRNGAELLVLNTHARKGLSRMVLGSFAETAMLKSKTPLLVINPHTVQKQEFKHVFFPTDLSTSSKKAFGKIVKRAKKWGADITLFHKLPDPIEPVVQTGVHMAGGGWVSVYQYLDKESASRRKECEKFAQVATKAGLETKIIVEEKPGYVVDAIMEHAKENKADLITMASRTGSVSSVLIGSVARQLARVSDIPVWIQHYDEK